MISSTIVPALKKHTATVIFLHVSGIGPSGLCSIRSFQGLGDTGYGWLPAVRSLTRANPTTQHIKWILPHAPKRPITINHGLSMPAWFDMYDFSLVGSEEDREGMLESAGVLKTLIQQELDETGLHSSRIVLGGFSQGGAMSLLTGLTAQSKLGGLIVLSAWLPLQRELKEVIVVFDTMQTETNFIFRCLCRTQLLCHSCGDMVLMIHLYRTTLRNALSNI